MRPIRDLNLCASIFCHFQRWQQPRTKKKKGKLNEMPEEGKLFWPTFRRRLVLVLAFPKFLISPPVFPSWCCWLVMCSCFSSLAPLNYRQCMAGKFIGKLGAQWFPFISLFFSFFFFFFGRGWQRGTCVCLRTWVYFLQLALCLCCFYWLKIT